MSRWKPAVTKEDVAMVFRAHPTWTSTQIAEVLDTSPEYVRAALRREGFVLAGATGPRRLQAGKVA